MALLTVRFTKIIKTAKLPLIIVIIILNLLVIVTFNFLLIVHVWRSFLGNGSKKIAVSTQEKCSSSLQSRRDLSGPY